jgi:hypothetical protein
MLHSVVRCLVMLAVHSVRKIFDIIYAMIQDDKL